jgi:hypothetical protein
MVVAFGSSEYALRAFPLACSLLSLPLFALVARRLLRGPGAILAVALFALSSGVALYAAEAKQYASDVLVALALFELTLRWLEHPSPARFRVLLLTGVLSPFFSQPSVFVLVGVGLAVLLTAPRPQRGVSLVLLAAWAVTTALSIRLVQARASPGLMAYLRWFWRDGFPPEPTTSLADVFWPVLIFRDLFGRLLVYPWPSAYAVVAGLGLVSFCRSWRAGTTVVLFPLAVALAAAVARAYPLQLRLALFLVPTILLLVAAGAALLARPLGRPALRNLLLVVVAVPVLVSLVRRPPVWRLDEVRPVFAELQRRRQPGDAVYAYYPTWQAIRFYGPRYGLGLDVVDVGACHPRDLHDYLRDLDRYRGRRVWFLNAFPLVRLGEAKAMENYLRAIGRRVDLIEGPPTTRPQDISLRGGLEARPPVSASLFDLTDSQRLASTRADQPELPPIMQYGDVPRCVYGPIIPHLPSVGQTPTGATQANTSP